jgi:tyrosine kinase receptor 1
MSRPANYYTSNPKAKPIRYVYKALLLKIRWTAIEGLLFEKFYQESDIWSLGVVIWEIYSDGDVPYKDHPESHFKESLKNGLRLQKPKNCDEATYKIMSDCWKEKKDER